MSRATDDFAELVGLVPREEIRIVGAWSSKAQRRYASRAQLGSGAGPYVETVFAGVVT